MRKPVGVVAVISPWNFPYILTLRAVAPALALGNAVVLKPSEETPLAGGLLVAEVFEEAGVPPGVLNVITCARGEVAEVGDVMVTHPAVGVISFTGSTATGRGLAEKAGRNLKRIVLELGGKSPIIVLETPTSTSRERRRFGGFFHQCRSAWPDTRIIVELRCRSLCLAARGQARPLKRRPDEAETPLPRPSPTRSRSQAHLDAVANGSKVRRSRTRPTSSPPAAVRDTLKCLLPLGDFGARGPDARKNATTGASPPTELPTSAAIITSIPAGDGIGGRHWGWALYAHRADSRTHRSAASGLRLGDTGALPSNFHRDPLVSLRRKRRHYPLAANARSSSRRWLADGACFPLRRAGLLALA